MHCVFFMLTLGFDNVLTPKSVIICQGGGAAEELIAEEKLLLSCELREKG